MSRQRVLRNKGANIETTFEVGETPTNADGAVTVTITRADGTVLANDAATIQVVGSTGKYRYVLAPQANLDRLTVVWTGTFSAVVEKTTTYVEIVGGFYFSLGQARASDSALSSTTDYPTASIVEIRDEVEDEFEDYTDVAWVRRYRRVTLDGDGGDTLLLPDLFLRRILAASIDGTALTQAQIDDIALDDTGEIERKTLGSFKSGDKNIVIAYEHGFDAPPADLRRAALVRLRYRLTSARSAIPDRAVSYVADGGGNFTIATPGMRGSWTGIPEVDVVLKRRDHSVPGIA